MFYLILFLHVKLGILIQYMTVIQGVKKKEQI